LGVESQGIPFSRLNLETGKILDHVKFETGNLVMISGGNNIGRVGTITHEEKHPGSFDTSAEVWTVFPMSFLTHSTKQIGDLGRFRILRSSLT
jgi:ribosomal protein S4E